jgi:putative phosphoesterase
MRVALISDIHGNLTALEAVLADLGRTRPNQVVCLGDVASGGPQPHQVARRLARLGWPVVLGNTDAWLLDPRPVEEEDARRQRIAAHGRWCDAQLDAADRAYLQQFRQTIRVALGNGRTLLCYHGSPRSFDDWIPPTISEQELAAFLAGHRADVFAGGHTHQPMVRRHGAALVLNAGSVGRALGPASPGEPTPNAPWAEYALVSDEGGRLGVELIRLPFDLATHIRAILDSGMPHAEWEAANWRQER